MSEHDGKQEGGEATSHEASGASDAPPHEHHALLQHQLQQQQLQLLQFQQQQLQTLSQNMNPTELAALQQQQLALLMMPMLPLMMPLQQQVLATASMSTTSTTDTSTTTTSEATAGETAPHADDLTPASATTPGDEASPTYHTATPEALGFPSPFSGTDGFGLLGGGSGLNMEEAPKRKRGRPPKKDVAARAKAEAERALKQQLPMWGYGLPMPLLPGLPGMLPAMSNPGAVVRDNAASDELMIKEEEGEERPSKAAKKKQRGTGKPRGRPRTRPRPGEVIRRVKPLPIAPANYSVMYNYSLSNLAQKSTEMNADGSASVTDTTVEAQDESRLGPLSASLLPEEHEG
ncbi:hypothetical protein PsorP6_013054 [Peronosclerospora sorghi]|uniref:Uncharacterized protein n=1 Tax=Peronosclerospora sorghi TaxID=230839 RepID=A0ACC0WEY7_9STRA|nr:hypothetical protein PsorP6_013054 [Peronosclerospora sorghi]